MKRLRLRLRLMRGEHPLSSRRAPNESAVRAAHPLAASRKSGFTIPELLVSVAVAGILTVVMLTVTLYFYADILYHQATAELAIENQFILRRLVDDTRTADAIHDTNLLDDPNAPVGGWQTSNPNNVLIIATPAQDASRQIIYNPEDELPYENELIYYGDGNIFRRRVLANPSAPGNAAVTTCPEASATPSCPADAELSVYLDGLAFEFFDIDNQLTGTASLARSVSIDLALSRHIFSRDVIFDNHVRTTLRNY